MFGSADTVIVTRFNFHDVTHGKGVQTNHTAGGNKTYLRAVQSIEPSTASRLNPTLAYDVL